MYSAARLAGKYLRYYLTASNGHGHGIHSPFVFDFVRQVLNDRTIYSAYLPVEKLRRQLKKDPTLLEIEDFGAGSLQSSARQRKIADIAKHAAKSKKMGQLLFRIAQYYKARSVLELGSSLGLSTAYLSAGAGPANVRSIEGSPAVAAAARRHLDSLGFNDTELIVGNFDVVLTDLLKKMPKPDMVFVDGNHRREPTLRYFNELLPHCQPSSVLIFDDIHWSAEMEDAWEQIKRDGRIYLTIDLFFVGLVFLREEFKAKQDFVIRF